MSVYNLADEFDRQRFKKRVRYLYKSNRLVEVVDVSHRTKSQYNYCHFSIQFFAAEMGESFEKVKQVYFKRMCNPDIFIRREKDKVTGEEIEVVLSINDIKDITTMSKCIDAWVRWCAEHGVIIPPPDDEENLRKAASYISMVENYMR